VDATERLPFGELKTNSDPYTPPVVDPGIASPSLGNDDNVNNNFEYGTI